MNMNTNKIMKGKEKALTSSVFLLCLLCVCCCKSLISYENPNDSYIYCRYAGYQDKPMYSCKFQLNPVMYPASWDEWDIVTEYCFNTSFCISRKEFESIKEITRRLKNNSEIEKRPRQFFGCYQIVIKNNSHDSCYYYLSRDKSREYFQEIDKLKLKNDTIHDKLKSMILRL